MPTPNTTRRLYSPSTGRFLSMDPIHDGSANAYDYAGADPVNQFDLSGLSKHNYNGHHWHWLGGYEEIDMTHKRALQLADAMNANAGKAAVLGIMFAALPGSDLGAWIFGVISGLYWWISGDIYTELNEHPSRGVKLYIGTGWFNVTHE
ncbi:RHS repeat-associated core domain-containing protein [Streptomyces sp. NPDC054766]